MERIGIYGGTFSPPHLGHIRAARTAVEMLQLSKMLMIPSCIPPHKAAEVSASADQRLEMLNLATAQESELEASDLELQRGGVSYTYETVAQLRKQYPDAELILCMGSDMFLALDSWREPQRILEQASIGVFLRGEPEERDGIAAMQEKLESRGGKVYRIGNPVTKISSTDIRRLLLFGCADPYLPDGVGDYIRKNGLYGTGRDYRGLSIEELESVVTGLLKPNRVAHVLGCRDTAVELAKLWGTDETEAARAALLHDVTKALDGPAQLTLCREYGMIPDDFSGKNPKTIHALTGSLVADRVFGESGNVVSAIRCHTTGKANMNMLEKIIYVADYIEPNRDFPGVDSLRSLAHTDIDSALKRGLEMTLEMLKRQGREVSPESMEALCYLQAVGR